jgi:hypothetical protein
VEIGAASSGANGAAQTLVRYRDLLKELFIVSDVATLPPAQADALRSRAGGQEEFSENGAYFRAPAGLGIALKGRRAPGVKCQRCWCYFDDGGDPELCPRCRAVVRA